MQENSSHFSPLYQEPADSIFGLQQKFISDTRKEKLDLTTGVFHNAQGQAWILEAVKKAELLLCKEETSKSYLPISGDSQFLKSLHSLLFTEDLPTNAIQTPGGTGALFIGGSLISKSNYKSILLPSPTWANHASIFQHLGFTISYYPYYKEHQFVFSSLMSFLYASQEKSVILLHASCHNPSGMDFSVEEWEEILTLCKKKDLLPFFDFAYHGLKEGLEKDILPLSLCVKKGLEILVAYSCSKNFGLYKERTGALFLLTHQKRDLIQSNIEKIARACYSNPPAHGALVVQTILSSPSLKALWHKEVSLLKENIDLPRVQLIQAIREQGLEKHLTPSLVQGKGMFALLRLTPEEVEKITCEKGIYLLHNGRINLSGLSKENIDKIVEALLCL